MVTIREKLLIARKWLGSFRRAEWSFDDYPVRVRQNHIDDLSIAWVAEILNWLGPTGLGPTPETAIAELKADFSKVIKARLEAGKSIPRPGSDVPIEFATSTRINADPQLLEIFLHKVFGFEPGRALVFVSDESSLYDFLDYPSSNHEKQLEHFYQLIRSHFGVDASNIEGARISDILDRIKAHRAKGTVHHEDSSS